jgi:hypothetical protein
MCEHHPDIKSSTDSLLVIVIGLVVDDVEELELVDTLASGDHAEPVTELHLLEELLGPAQSDEQTDGSRLELRGNSQVLQVSAGQLVVGDDLDLALALLVDHDGLAKVANTAIDLDLVLEELLEGGGVEDLVAGRLLGVDDELHASQHCGTIFHPSCEEGFLTFFVTLPALLLW